MAKKRAEGPKDVIDLSIWKEDMAEHINTKWPILRDLNMKEILAKYESPKIGARMFGRDERSARYWSERDLEKLNQKAPTVHGPTNQHEDTARDRDPSYGRKLYKTSLRVWNVFPTEIISPFAGLVYGSKHDPDIQSKLIEMEWPTSFSKSLMPILIHNIWQGNMSFMAAAIKFTCICRCDDRRPCTLPLPRRDPLYMAIIYCQDKAPQSSVPKLLDAVRKRLKEVKKWPSREFEVFHSIAEVAWKCAKCTSKRGRRRPKAKPQFWFLHTVRTSHLKLLARALDRTMIHGAPFLPSSIQKKLFNYARACGRPYARDPPINSAEYIKYRKIALKYLRQEAIVYEHGIEENPSVRFSLSINTRVITKDEESSDDSDGDSDNDSDDSDDDLDEVLDDSHDEDDDEDDTGDDESHSSDIDVIDETPARTPKSVDKSTRRRTQSIGLPKKRPFPNYDEEESASKKRRRIRNKVTEDDGGSDLDGGDGCMNLPPQRIQTMPTIREDGAHIEGNPAGMSPDRVSDGPVFYPESVFSKVDTPDGSSSHGYGDSVQDNTEVQQTHVQSSGDSPDLRTLEAGNNNSDAEAEQTTATDQGEPEHSQPRDPTPPESVEEANQRGASYQRDPEASNASDILAIQKTLTFDSFSNEVACRTEVNLSKGVHRT
ncbi:hypothetical protein F5B22DRAFT_661289 [Xylaria bambusicola]|uniref:uncharacterized protein n=1 Tax=Xylaria bambusicola TaxID=326684 RepID=UPI0020078FEC|nr:uncharacterized protein F5B22DRAFT_661289 [Xylaria bambusicola]KAI0521917.1 hypothetical protein F5B22DRAFT_661289 [Xylaria bambusicola]